MLLKNITIFFATLLLGTGLWPALSEADTLDVDIASFTFDPLSITVNVGDTVRWTNQDIAPHTSTSLTLIWDSGTLNNLDQFEYEFLLPPGSYDYECTIHASMPTATVNVVGCFVAAVPNAIPASLGGTVSFSLDSGVVNAGRQYLMLGTVTGTAPGLPLPGGLATLPINWDVFTDIVVSLLNSGIFVNFLGNLDVNGQANALLVSPALSPVFVGTVMHFAYALNNPWDCASNPVAVTII